MSITELKHTLRKYEFPNCAKEALIRIEQLLVGRSAPSSKQVDVAMDIIAEFVFCETDRRGPRRAAPLSPLQELQLIDVMCEYLDSCANEITKNTVFLSMFGGVDGLRRLKILSILASMAVSASNTAVLLAVGVWLHQMGCSSTQSLQLVENIVRDHFYLNTTNQASLRSLATTAPQFVANFITAVTELYMQDVQGVRKMPPKNLLEVITSWVSGHPQLCRWAMLAPAALPSGAIPMAGGAPLAGLVAWCALAPLYLPDDDTDIVEVTTPLKRIKLEHEAERTIKQVTHRELTESELYTKLHLGVLNSLRAGRRPAPPAAPAPALGAHLLVALANRAQSHALALTKRGVKLQTDEKLQTCLDRIGQSVQVALANGCIYGNINSLLATLDTLPENRLLKIVIKTHQPM